jgi:hypothetical protein
MHEGGGGGWHDAEDNENCERGDSSSHGRELARRGISRHGVYHHKRYGKSHELGRYHAEAVEDE